MPTLGTYTTPEGVTRLLGKYWVRENRNVSSGKLRTAGNLQEVEFEIDLTRLPDGTPNFDADRNNDSTLDGFSPNNGLIPANSSIVSATVFTREGAVGGASIDVGLFQYDGTPVDAAGLASVAAADMASVGQRFEGAGAFTVPATSSSGSVDTTVGITGTGEFTEGKVQVVVQFTLN